MMRAMKQVLDTLFLPISSGQISGGDSPVLFMNAQVHPALSRFKTITNIQYFKPYTAGLEISENVPEFAQFSMALILGSKSRIETEIYLGKALLALETNGVLICAADNKEGAGRLKKMLQDLDVTGIGELSKNKARVCWGVKPESSDFTLAQRWADQDKVQEISGGFFSRPGIYGWDKIDKGSALLVEHLPGDLSGHGADFGCGYGFLSCAVLDKCRKAKSVEYIDADSRAVEMAAKNLERFEHKKSGLWLDLASSNTGLENKYDWVVMNPPFHEGRKTDSDIGVAFIKNAHKALRRKGQLLMVANNQLPYERVLSEVFWSAEMIAQGGGFKVFRAVK